MDEIETILKGSEMLSDVKKTYQGDFENIPFYPAITVELKNRTHKRMGMGGLYETTCFFNVWVYVNNPDYTRALDQLEDLTSRVEKVIQGNRNLNGVVKDSDISNSAEFGVADRGGVFLQTALINLETTSKLQSN